MSEISQLTQSDSNGVHITSIMVKKNTEEISNHVQNGQNEVNNVINKANHSDIKSEINNLTTDHGTAVNNSNRKLDDNENMSIVVNNKVSPGHGTQGTKVIDDLLPAESLYTTQGDGCVRLRMTEKGAGSETPQTVVSLLKTTAERIPNNAALCVKRNDTWVRWTYKQYYDQSCSAAKSFIKAGLELYHGVGIMGFNSPEWFLADMGCIFAGGFAVGMYTTNNSEACQFIASDSKAQVIVVENTAYLKKILQVKDELPDLKAIVQYSGEIETPQDNLYSWDEFMKLGDDLPDSALEDRFNSLAPNKCCTLIYTSGTTGKPKGVMLSHDNVTWTPVNTGPLGRFVFGVERLVSYLPLSHVAAQYLDIYLPIYFGSTVFFAQPDALKGSLVVTLKEVRPTGFMGVPRVWEKMMDKLLEIGRNNKGLKLKIATWAKSIGLKGNKNKMNNGSVPFGWTLANALAFKRVKEGLGLDLCKIMFSGAAPITKDTLEYFMSLDIMVDEVYGMSECSGPHSFSRPGGRRFGCVGSVSPGVFTRIDNPDEEGNGEILMYGRHVFMGYLQQEEKTKEVITDEGWLRTGDIGRVDKDGFLFITGRIKELIITAGGENIAPVPVEDVVKECLPCISNCMLIGDKCKFLSMFLTVKCNIDPETQESLEPLAKHAIEWCESIGSSAKTVTEFRQDEAVKKAIQEGITAANKKAVSRAAIIQKWTILPQDFTVFSGELGPTLKLRRPIVVTMYSKEIEEFYAE